MKQIKQYKNAWRNTRKYSLFSRILIMLELKNMDGAILIHRALRDTYWPIHRKIGLWWNKLRYRPIYYSFYGRDCDMCEWGYVEIYDAGKKSFERMQKKELEWADGPMSWTIIAKGEYEEYKNERYHRDRVMEAYENGRGTSIYV